MAATRTVPVLVEFGYASHVCPLQLCPHALMAMQISEGSYTLLGASGLSPGVGEGMPVPVGLGPVPSEGRALHGMPSFSGLDYEDTPVLSP